MTTQKKKKSAKEKKVLIGSVVVAAAIVAGSTFAWFSSKDEVTNRLTASADYNVSIVEDFQPPKEWIPGQTVNKDVAAVNTGNVDAFVRMWLGGTMRVLSDTSDINKVDVLQNNVTNGLVEVTDDTKNNVGLTYAQTSGEKSVYFRTLSTDPKYNSDDQVNEETNQPAKFSEVQSMQAGGILVYAPQNAGYHWTVEQATDYKMGTSNDYTIQNLARGVVVGSENSSETLKVAGLSETDHNYYGAIDASTFKPETTGLYLFRRNIGDTVDGEVNKYEYSGYYYDADKDVYFALHTVEGSAATTANGHSDYVLPKDAVDDHNVAPSNNQVLPVIVNEDKVYFYTATEELFETTKMTWGYDNADNKYTVTTTLKSGKQISVDINLDNVGTDKNQWSLKAPANNAWKDSYLNTFYYTNDLEAGDTTVKLVDSLTLSPDTEVGTYLAFDFDLNVFMDSIQVTVDETGKEGNETIASGWETKADDLNIGAAGTIATYEGESEIDTITWN